jgi:hypothetical protein
MRFLTVALFISALIARPAVAEGLEGHWRMTFDSKRIGVLDAVIEFEGEGEIYGRHASPAKTDLRMVLDQDDTTPGTMEGKLITPFGNANISLALEGGSLSGSFEGDITGTVTGVPFSEELPLRDYGAVLAAIDNITKAWLYDLRFTQTPEWTQFHDKLVQSTSTAQDDFDMIAGFQEAWGEGLFSHYELLRPLKSMESLLKQADTQSEEKPIVHTSFTEDNIGLVTIDSFFGSKIEQQIDDAFKVIIDRNPRALIIDVRQNGGGTLAAWPVAARLIQEEVLAGYFISNRWWATHTTLPTTETLIATPSPEFVTPQAFQQDLFSDGLLVMRIGPYEMTYDGPVYVLVSEHSRSATEALIGVLQSIGRVTVVGETTAGYMLNSNLFEIAEGFTLRLPVADFFLANHKSLERVGVIPNIQTQPDEADDVTLKRIRLGEAE